jgi:hypothetical protein
MDNSFQDRFYRYLSDEHSDLKEELLEKIGRARLIEDIDDKIKSKFSKLVISFSNAPRH